MKNLYFVTAVFSLFLITLAFGRPHIYRIVQFSAYRFGVNLNSIASSNYAQFIKSQSGDFDYQPKSFFLNREVSFLDVALNPNNQVLGSATTRGEKSIMVKLSEQRLYMREGDIVVGSFLISSGKWAPTPTGKWPIWIKLRYTRMRGGSKALGTFYDLPNVPYVMYYYQGYGIHGAYWHNNFGHPMSHGCINMKPQEAGIVYNWADVGTNVIVQN